MSSSCFDSNNSGAANSRDLICAKRKRGTNRGNIVVVITKIYIQLQIGADSDILIAEVGNPIVKFSRGS